MVYNVTVKCDWLRRYSFGISMYSRMFNHG
jgi:hypothetical protein